MTFQFQRPNRPVTKVYIHCSASDRAAHDNVATIRAWHLARGWSDVGYNIFGRKSGRWELGRSLERTPAAQGGHNRGTIAICLHGLKEERFTVDQIEGLKALCFEINRQYGGKVTFHGHREVAAKLCPVIDYQDILKLDASGRLGLDESDIDPAALHAVNLGDLSALEEAEAAPSSNRHKLVLRLGSTGWWVRYLQKALTGLGYHVGRIDGDFGKRTRAAVLAFQEDNYLIADGIVGPATYEALEDAENREVGDKRASATLSDLKAGGSRIATASINGQVGSGLLTAGGALAVFEQSTGVISQLSDSAGMLQGVVGSLGPWIGVGVIAIGLYLGWQAWKAGRARVDDHRTGKTA